MIFVVCIYSSFNYILSSQTLVIYVLPLVTPFVNKHFLASDLRWAVYPLRGSIFLSWGWIISIKLGYLFMEPQPVPRHLINASLHVRLRRHLFKDLEKAHILTTQREKSLYVDNLRIVLSPIFHFLLYPSRFLMQENEGKQWICKRRDHIVIVYGYTAQSLLGLNKYLLNDSSSVTFTGKGLKLDI